MKENLTTGHHEPGTREHRTTKLSDWREGRPLTEERRCVRLNAMGQLDQRRRMVIRFPPRRLVSDISNGRTRQKMNYREKKTKICPCNLPGTIDSNLNDRRSHLIGMRIRQRDGITVIVLRLIRMRMACMIMNILMSRRNMMIVVVVKIEQIQPGIMMESPRPNHQGKDREKSHQETVLTSEHCKKSRGLSPKVKHLNNFANQAATRLAPSSPARISSFIHLLISAPGTRLLRNSPARLQSEGRETAADLLLSKFLSGSTEPES